MTDKATLKQHARELRNYLTDAEQALWFHLRRRQIHDVRFLRQHSFGNYILDFHAPPLHLAIEVDGGQHFNETDASYDARRDTWLKAQGITILRFTNREVMQQREAVLEEIGRVVRQLQAHPPDASRRPPSFRRE